MAAKSTAGLRPWWTLEDWVVVWVGFTAIAAIAAGYRPLSLAAKWSAVGDLGGLLAPEVLGVWMSVAIPVFVFAVVGIALLRERVGAYAKAFPEIGRAVQQECRDRSRMPSSA
eukprot:TRINITY_DN23989_c0_g1_i2.p3 TRINITY_DN23989_c0_g1~~TRINITY_DN23989_c0_g1_i2.p3  ORF type:complete len:113 (+),score=24.67 TRINITY_DN23989_c0_g1_i2:128-466(+)